MIKGLPADAICCTIIFSVHDAGIKGKDGPFILLRKKTSSDDITELHVAKGLL